MSKTALGLRSSAARNVYAAVKLIDDILLANAEPSSSWSISQWESTPDHMAACKAIGLIAPDTAYLVGKARFPT